MRITARELQIGDYVVGTGSVAKITPYHSEVATLEVTKSKPSYTNSVFSAMPYRLKNSCT